MINSFFGGGKKERAKKKKKQIEEAAPPTPEPGNAGNGLPGAPTISASPREALPEATGTPTPAASP
jgi:hypothetical protein